MRYTLSSARLILTAALIAATASPAFAQLDPLAFMKTVNPNVLLVVDVANRMQRDAPTDNSTTTTSTNTSAYYDPFLYAKTNASWETGLIVNSGNTTTNYRRKYVNLGFASGTDKYTATTIKVTGDLDGGYSTFAAPTRLSIARAAMYQAVSENQSVVRFGLIQMRQKSPTIATQGNSGPVADADLLQQQTETGSNLGRWQISRPTVQANNGLQTQSGVLVKADSGTANADTLARLAKDARTAGGLLPAGNDDTNTVDAPVKYMLDDAKTEASRLITVSNDPTCRNTVVVLIVGGGEGNTATGLSNSDLSTAASSFLNVSGRRVPVYVIAIAPPQSDVASLKAIATTSGGQYFEITKSQINTALGMSASTLPSPVTGTVIVPEVVKAINVAVAHAFATSTDVNTAPTATQPFGPSSEYQVTSPIIGTVDLTDAKDINNTALPNTVIYNKTSQLIPQRSNVMVTTAMTVPTINGVAGALRAFRVYKPVADSSQFTGYKFSADGTRLWVACVPGLRADGSACSTPPGTVLSDSARRNLFTAAADGSMIAFTTANAAALAPLMNLSTSDATLVIDAVRRLPLGAIVDSTPAIMNAPSLDPPPDEAYISFAAANKGRRSIVWVGTNRGILEAIDARDGVEVWGYIPVNLLPKLRTLLDGQPIGKFDYFMDGSPKIADVKIDGTWRTNLIIGEGPGGTFYQSFDVTLADMTSGCTACASSSDDISSVLTYFSDPTKIKFNWAFPSYSSFDPALTAVQPHGDSRPYGDIKSTASDIEKTVGQTWSDPAVGQIYSAAGPPTILVGSGFLPYTSQQQTNRGGKVAGTTFYLLSAKDGTVYDTKDVGSDGAGETLDNCASLAGGCTQMKNALQSDPVATGPSDSRFITKTYIPDLDGRVFRFDIALDATNEPTITGKTKLYESSGDQPIFSSMATVNVGGATQYIFFGTGSDLLPNTSDTTIYQLIGLMDNGPTGTVTFAYNLQKLSGKTAEERVTSFPAVAGDIVFFTTSLFKPATPCTPPDARLYAFTFKGGPAYDTNGDGKFSNTDSQLVKTVAGQRATAPFIVDQHVVFGTQGKVSMFGDPDDFNNGIGQAGVRILSWREVR